MVSTFTCNICHDKLSKSSNFMIFDCKHKCHVSCFLKKNAKHCQQCINPVENQTSDSNNDSILKTPPPRKRVKFPPSIHDERQQKQKEIRNENEVLRKQLCMELRIPYY